MRVAMALSQPPLPEGGAPGKCAVALLRGLVAHGVEVQAVAADRRSHASGGPYAAVPEDLPVTVVPIQESWSRARIWVHKLRRPRGELSFGAFDTAFVRAAEGAELVHLEEIETGWCGLDRERPRVLHVHYLTAEDRGVPMPWQPGLGHATELRYAERRLVRMHRWLVASSPLVAERLEQMNPRARVLVAPLGLDPADYPVRHLDGPPIAGLIGTGNWPPTATAIQRLVRDIWPRVRRNLPTARLRVAGRNTHWLRPDPSQGLEVLGEVDSAVEFFAGLSVLAYPLVRGSGMKVKVLEAMASGVPVVTTPRGAEGIGATEGVRVELEDDDLVAALVETLRDLSVRAERGRAARRDFVDRFSPLPIASPIVEFYREIANT